MQDGERFRKGLEIRREVLGKTARQHLRQPQRDFFGRLGREKFCQSLSLSGTIRRLECV